MKAIILGLIAILICGGCTDATRAHLSQFNDPADVDCFSGGKVIYHGSSTGKIQSNADEDGIYFKEQESGKFVRLYADCIVRSR